ncbi:MAG: ribosome silencing factor [Dehalococcoidia bacterium]
MTRREAREGEKRSLSLEEKTNLCTEAARIKKAYDLVVLDLREHSSITDYFLICSANSTRQVKAIADAVDEQLGKKGVHALGTEGYTEARWVLLDYGQLVVHVFHHETRKFYDLEKLWGSAPVIFRHRGEELG